MVRKGEMIHRHAEWSRLDAGRLAELIESAFGKTLVPGWLQQLSLLSAYVSDTYRAAAVVAEMNGFSYLDKFAIHETARGEGFARTVWDHMIRDFPKLFWRSRSDNGFNAFYEKEADGLMRTGQWTVFWKGEDDFDRIAMAMKVMTDLPPSFEEDQR